MTNPPRRGLLDTIEWLGNKLPDPVFLFFGAALLVMALSAVGVWAGWSVQPLKPVPVTAQVAGPDGAMIAQPVLEASGRPKIELVPSGDPVTARSLLSSEGLHWAITSMVRNFINFPPLGIVLVGILGVGLAEKVGMFGALMKALAAVTPRTLLTPTIVFLGIISNITSDAGYIVLPPLAAALFAAFGRSPVAGLAAAFAGISAGFSANLIPSATDALVGGITTDASRTLDRDYVVTPVANWGFMAGSTVLLTFVGWAVTAWIVEPRLKRKPADEGGPPASLDAAAGDAGSATRLSAAERRGLLWTALAFAGVMAAFLSLVLIPGAPLHGSIQETPTRTTARWSQAIIPMVFVGFAVPGIAYGIATAAIRSQKDIAKALIAAMSGMAPIIVLAFFAAQFLEYLKYSNLDKMLAFIGGKALVESGLPPLALLPALVILSLTINILISSMSAKWAMLAPILVPMLMMAGISPELTQAAYRVGDSVTNCCTPMNAYMLIILVTMQRYWKSSGIGTLIATMLPFSVVFGVIWIIFLVAWVYLGVPLGPDTHLWYVPVAH